MVPAFCSAMALPKTWQGRIVPRRLRSEDEAEGLCGEVEKGLRGARRRPRVVAARGVDEDVDASPPGEDLPGRPLERVALQDVGGDSHGASAGGVDLADEPLPGLPVEVEDGDRGPRAGQRPRDLAAEDASAPGHDGRLAREDRIAWRVPQGSWSTSFIDLPASAPAPFYPRTAGPSRAAGSSRGASAWMMTKARRDRPSPK